MAMSSVDWRASLVRQVTCGSSNARIAAIADVRCDHRSGDQSLAENQHRVVEIRRRRPLRLVMSVDLDAVPVSHPAEKQALADLLTRLEHETDIPGVTQKQIDAAPAEVARDMDWLVERLAAMSGRRCSLPSRGHQVMSTQSPGRSARLRASSADSRAATTSVPS